MKPTDELYHSLQLAYVYFNRKLFQKKLPNVIFTVQRQKGILGYFAPDRWSSLDGTHCHEIAINPTHMGDSRLIEVLQTLVHEMVHCWQYCFGTPSRASYHNKEWAYKMKEIGLQPTATGLPGGAITGQTMSDYPIENGRFLQACYHLVNEQSFNIPWIDRRHTPKSSLLDNATQQLVDGLLESGNSGFTNETVAGILTTNYAELMPKDTFISVTQKDRAKTTYQCPECLCKVWGKPDLHILCGDCEIPFELV